MLGRLRGWWLLIVLVALLGCSEDESDRAVVGPGIDVHCAGESRSRPGLGDTDVKVTCLQPAE
jgi:hypothetical protein